MKGNINSVSSGSCICSMNLPLSRGKRTASGFEIRVRVKRSFIILSLLVAGGMAHAASPIYSWEWTTEGTQITAPGWNGSFNYTTGNDYATFGSGSGGGTPYNSGIAGISGSFTVSFDLKNLSSTNNAWKDVFSPGNFIFTTRDLEANPAETSIQA